jgi:hypothetical protein
MKNGSLSLRYSNHAKKKPFLFRREVITWQQQLITELLPSNGLSYSCLLSGRCLAQDACHINNNNNEDLLYYYEKIHGKGITSTNTWD